MILNVDFPLFDHYTGEQLQGPIHVIAYGGCGWAVEVDGDMRAYLNVETHGFWARNPRLRDRILMQLRAEYLIGVP